MIAQGKTPNLAAVLPAEGWEERHSPGNFTYAAHQAFFAGFFPTPIAPGIHPRPFELRFEGSTTIAETTWILDSANILNELAEKGYHTACIGGVGFFNKLKPLSKVLPSLFDESYWSPELGVTNPKSTEKQMAIAQNILTQTPPTNAYFY